MALQLENRKELYTR